MAELKDFIKDAAMEEVEEEAVSEKLVITE